MKKLLSLFTALLFVGSMWGVAPQGTTLFSENFGGYAADAVPSGSVTTATNYRVVYGNASVTYTCTNGTKSSGNTNGGTTKVMNAQQGAGGALPELMVGKKGSGDAAVGGTFSIAGIPSGDAKVITVSYKQNANGLSATITGTGYSTTFESSSTKATTSFDVTVDDGAASTFTLTLQALSTSNVRVDDILITVKTAGATDDPTITAEPTSLSVNAEAHLNQSIALTYTNWSVDAADAQVTIHSAISCTEENKITEPTWISNIDIADDFKSFTFDIAANTDLENARTLYLRFYALGEDVETESTVIIPITQAKAPLSTMDQLMSVATGSDKTQLIKFDNWKISAISSSTNAFLTDGEKGLIIYTYNDHGFVEGNIISGTIECTLTKYNGALEIKNIKNTTEGLTVTTGGTITPIETTLSELAAINTGSVVTLHNMYYNGSTLSDGDKAISAYSVSGYTHSLESGKTYNVTGVYQYNTSGNRLYIRKDADYSEVAAASVSPDAIDFGSVGVGDDAPAAKTITITGTNLESALSIAALTNYDYAVTEGSLTPSEGSVNATVTITPKSGFTTAAGQKDETLTITGGGIANNVTVDITAVVKNKYTVTWNNNGNTRDTIVLDGDKPAFPATPESCDATSTTFVGWATAAWSGKIESIIGKTVYTTADAMPAVEDDITYYAVFVNETEGEPVTKWVLTALDAVTEGVYALLTTNYKAFNGTINDSGHGTVTSDAFSFTNSEATSAPEGTCELTFTAVSDGFTMYNEDLGYLYAKANSSGNLAWHEEENSYWYLANENWSYKLNSARLRSYNNTTFRTYSANNGNVMVLAKKTTVPSKAYTDYMTTCPDDPTAIDNTEVEGKAVKVLRNGILLIEKNGRTYNAMGQVVK